MKFVALMVSSLILSEVDTVAIALPAYIGLLNFAPPSITSMTSVIA